MHDEAGNNIGRRGVNRDISERNDLAKYRQDIALRLRPLLAAWEAEVDAEAGVD